MSCLRSPLLPAHRLLGLRAPEIRSIAAGTGNRRQLGRPLRSTPSSRSGAGCRTQRGNRFNYGRMATERTGVSVHCAPGRGITATVIGAAMGLMGLPEPELIDLLNRLHMLRSGKPWSEKSVAEPRLSIVTTMTPSFP